MKRYKLLIIAWYANIDHVSEFIRNLKSTNPCVDICLMTSRPSLADIPEDVLENTSKIVCFKYYSGIINNRHITELIDRFYFLRTFIQLSKRRFDIVNIHYARPRLRYVLHWIKKMSKNIVISPWGSDILRVEDRKRIQHLKSIYKIADYVTVSKDSQIGQRLIERFEVDPHKMVSLGWGGEFFDYIQECSNQVMVEEAKARFGLNGRYVITCGYNTQREQRHEDIINAIYAVKNQLPVNLTLLFPFTYGRTSWSDGYTMRIKKKAKELGFDILAVEDHLSMPDLFMLRMATDIFVHVQTTDAGSRCVMEYVSCNKKVVHGSWIKYVYLDKYRPSCYFPVDQMTNLGKCIVNAYNAIIEPLPQEVTNIILERGWKHRMVLWNHFFESLVSGN